MSAQQVLSQDANFGMLRSHEGSYLIDAEPFVMIRCRDLFKNGSGGPEGNFTHRTLSIPKTQDNAKDLLWLMSRYPLDAPQSLLDELEFYALRYDRALKAARQGDLDRSFELSPTAFEMAEPARPHQTGCYNLWRKVRRLLLADGIGLGKTISAICGLCESETRPALIVVPTHLALQWQKQIKRFLPGASTHVIKGTKPYDLPTVDVQIITYTRLAAWQYVLVPMAFNTVVFDEVQDLRHVDTAKRVAARAISAKAEYTIGLSATPIYNMGGEIWSIIDLLYPDTLGPKDDFQKEWCVDERVIDPVALNSYLKHQGLMLRRLREDIGVEYEPVMKDVITLEGDIQGLAAIHDVAKTLAMSVLSNVVGESENSARELDWKLRHATGVAKAKAVAEFVKLLIESGEKVLLAGWHRDVYDIWERAFGLSNIVMYTGSESPAQKQAAVDAFVSGGRSVFICSLRSGAGLDGLQHVCSNIVFGELDWSPHVMDQMVGRLDREGQTRPVNAYYLTIDDGSDPFIMSVLGDKLSQHDGLIEGKVAQAEILSDTGLRRDRIRAMAESYLISIGEAVPQPVPTVGLQAEIAAALARIKLPSNSEREMQDALWSVLPGMVDAQAFKEVKIGERGRLDFLFTRGKEIVAIECKIDQTGRASVYRQVRRYAGEAGITGAIILAPWSGVANFVVENIPVTVVDWSKARLL